MIRYCVDWSSSATTCPERSAPPSSRMLELGWIERSPATARSVTPAGDRGAPRRLRDGARSEPTSARGRVAGWNPASIQATAARAWPAGESLERDGWVLRSTPEVGRRRSNSALPLAGAGTDPAAIAAVEAHYRERGARPLIQAAPLEERAALDAALASRGWAAGGATDVLVAPVGAVAAEHPEVLVEDGLPEMDGGRRPRGGATRSRTVGSSTRFRLPPASRAPCAGAGSPASGSAPWRALGRASSAWPPRPRPAAAASAGPWLASPAWAAGRGAPPASTSRWRRGTPPPGCCSQERGSPAPTATTTARRPTTTGPTGRPRSRAPRRSSSSAPAPPGGGASDDLSMPEAPSVRR